MAMSIPVTALTVPKSPRPVPGYVSCSQSAVQVGSTRTAVLNMPSTTCLRARKSVAQSMMITMTSDVPDASPAVAVIFAIPLATAVTSPAASTRAVRSSLVAQVTGYPGHDLIALIADLGR